ncbi:Csr1p NDAI_0J02150 [Naumovozyma dairenensis CBS 421]|uniref:CRAL-TRIO domain-containing protein n=1 Tax=Naumovozyma dairenensis (strain ATCC 10597 / BCRC 20456 / CBS 421 / NBRC 0211 / NRRL Y-12639) TaxID=1071378 RepID=G0WH29_NAUDC|nr:hypothetical protein NDAI_0J02150 [Naumovozyma dairenensis CBS 421]CCD27107.1 hypothetical protein NDAI_0J02150 [Naumovozyma dairenensis CBS 421]
MATEKEPKPLTTTMSLQDITTDQETTLKQIWTYLFHLWGIPVDGTNAFKKDPSLHSLSPQTSIKSVEKEPKKKSLFGKMYSMTGSSSSSSSSSFPPDSTQQHSQHHHHHKLNERLPYTLNMIHPEFKQLTVPPKDTRKLFWEMLRLDPVDNHILRFARARKWNTDNTIKMLSKTFQFRLTKKPINEILNKGEATIIKENKQQGLIKNLELQKAVIYNHPTENSACPLIVVRPKFHYSSDQTEEELEHYALLIIELARLFMREHSISILFDLTDFSLSNMDYTPVKFLIACFEAHYPESLSHLFVHKAPWLFSPIWSIVKNWLDPVVASKIVFTKNTSELERFLKPEQIPSYLGGKNDSIDLDHYVKPDGSHDDKLKDKEGLQLVQNQRIELIDKFVKLTVDWIQSETDEQSKELFAERCNVSDDICNNYIELDPFIRSRSSYDINGLLKL